MLHTAATLALLRARVWMCVCVYVCVRVCVRVRVCVYVCVCFKFVVGKSAGVLPCSVLVCDYCVVVGFIV